VINIVSYWIGMNIKQVDSLAGDYLTVPFVAAI